MCVCMCVEGVVCAQCKLRPCAYSYAEAMLPAKSVFLCYRSQSMDDIGRWPRVAGGGGPVERGEGGELAASKDCHNGGSTLR